VRRDNRLTRSADVKLVQRQGKRISHNLLLMAALPNEEKGLRVAVSANRSVGGAVQRNRAKRVLRAAIQPLAAMIKHDTDIVLTAKRNILTEKSTAVESVLHELLVKANLLK
jgi:ribonuclease P protein component